ncbi:MAG: hypothetical protein QW039_01515 [Fervidicoccaceae archaeon]
MNHKKIELNYELVDRLAWLTRIKLTEEEKKRLLEEIEIILSYINDILSLDIGAEEVTHLSPGTLRDDVVQIDVENGIDLLHQSILENGYVKGPKVYKG